MNRRASRRTALKTAITAASVAGSTALSYGRVHGANQRLNVASIGTGGKGWSDLNGVAASPDVQVVALCDIDSSREHLGRAAEKFSAAAQFQDWRALLDDSKAIDGVIVSTPDFMHAPIALSAMQLGKHIFCQKPLTHSVYEARQMRLAAASNKLVTQMGNQIQSHQAYRTAVSWVHAGLIGKVREVHSWQGGSPRWPRAIDRPKGRDSVPSNVRWDLWQGVAPRRPYKNEIYHPFNWRGWQPYGTGQLGDFGCHILDPVFMALGLTAPNSLIGQAPQLKPETWTDRATVSFEFPGTEATADSTISVTWYDSVGAQPPVASLRDLPQGFKLPRAGSVLVGEKGSLLIPHVADPQLFPLERFEEHNAPVVPGVDHYVQWADACRGVGKTTSHFDYAGPLAETVLLGTIAIRFPGEMLQWDAENLQITNLSNAQPFVSKEYRPGWKPPFVG